MNKEKLFTKGDLRKLIIPLLFEQALAITVGMADTMMISSVGEAAVSLIDMFNNLIMSISYRLEPCYCGTHGIWSHWCVDCNGCRLGIQNHMLCRKIFQWGMEEDLHVGVELNIRH